jgi:uncharacterized membrane protein
MPDFFNLHPALVHFPIAYFLLSGAAGLLHLFWRPSRVLRVLTWTAMLLGWLGAGLAVLSGLLAQSGLPPRQPYQTLLNWHISTGLAQLVLFGFLLYRWWLFGPIGLPGRRAREGTDYGDLLEDPAAKWWVAALLVGGVGVVLLSGWTGGRLVYEWGVNVMP